MEQIDHTVPPVVPLIGEIEAQMRRLVELDADAIGKLEALLRKLRVERSVEQHCH